MWSQTAEKVNTGKLIDVKFGLVLTMNNTFLFVLFVSLFNYHRKTCWKHLKIGMKFEQNLELCNSSSFPK